MRTTVLPILFALSLALAETPRGVRLQIARVVDRETFGKPLTAISVLLPAGWATQGRIRYHYTHGCYGNILQPVMKAASPDGRFGLELFPNHQWKWNSDRTFQYYAFQAQAEERRLLAASGFRDAAPCDLLPASNAEEYLRTVLIPQARPGARILRIEPLPELARPEQELRTAQIRDLQRRYGNSAQIDYRIDAARVRVSYIRDGRETEEWLAAFVHSLRTPQMSPAGRLTSFLNEAFRVFALRAPAGELDSQEWAFNLAFRSLHTGSEWGYNLQQVQNGMIAADLKTATQTANAWQRTLQDIRSKYAEANANWNRMRQEAAEQWDRNLRGAELRRNPETGELIELDGYHGRAWGRRGFPNEVIVSEDTFFDPNRPGSGFQGQYVQLVP